MTKIKGISEIVLLNRDQEASRAFYEDILGLKFMAKPNERGPIFLEAGEPAVGIPQMIVLVPLQPGSGEFQEPSHLHHIAFEVAPEDFDEVESMLRERGFEIRTGVHPVIPSRTIYVDDPDGNEVEIMCTTE